MRRVFNCIKSEEANEERGKDGRERERERVREREREEREREREGDRDYNFVKFDQGTRTNIVGT